MCRANAHVISTSQPCPTGTGLRVACLLRVANTCLAAIGRRRVGARSGLDPATARFGACAEGGKAAIHWNSVAWAKPFVES